MKDKDARQYVHARIDPDVYRALRLVAGSRASTMSAVIEEALGAWVGPQVDRIRGEMSRGMKST